MTQATGTQVQSDYDYEREMRRRAKVRAQHQKFEAAYAACLKEVENEPWFISMSTTRKERHLAMMAAEKFLREDCARSR